MFRGGGGSCLEGRNRGWRQRCLERILMFPWKLDAPALANILSLTAILLSVFTYVSAKSDSAENKRLLQEKEKFNVTVFVRQNEYEPFKLKEGFAYTYSVGKPNKFLVIPTIVTIVNYSSEPQYLTRMGLVFRDGVEPNWEDVTDVKEKKRAVWPVKIEPLGTLDLNVSFLYLLSEHDYLEIKQMANELRLRQGNIGSLASLGRSEKLTSRMLLKKLYSLPVEDGKILHVFFSPLHRTSGIRIDVAIKIPLVSEEKKSSGESRILHRAYHGSKSENSLEVQ